MVKEKSIYFHHLPRGELRISGNSGKTTIRVVFDFSLILKNIRILATHTVGNYTIHYKKLINETNVLSRGQRGITVLAALFC